MQISNISPKSVGPFSSMSGYNASFPDPAAHIRHKSLTSISFTFSIFAFRVPTIHFRFEQIDLLVNFWGASMAFLSFILELIDSEQNRFLLLFANLLFQFRFISYLTCQASCNICQNAKNRRTQPCAFWLRTIRRRQFQIQLNVCSAG